MEVINQNEMIKLVLGLTERGIVFKARSFHNGLQIYCDGWDAVCNHISYGHELGLIEVMGFGDDVIGCLSAEEVLKLVDSKTVI